MEDFFRGIFVRIFLGEIFWEDFLGGLFLGGFFWEELFGRIFLGRKSLFITLLKIFEYEWDIFVCQDFDFCQDFVSITDYGCPERN